MSAKHRLQPIRFEPDREKPSAISPGFQRIRIFSAAARRFLCANPPEIESPRNQIVISCV
jgi:hypothetical protein